MKRTKMGYLRHLAYRILPFKLYLKLWFKSYLGYYPNLKKPTLFNEKMCWLKMYYRKVCPDLLKLCFDKYRVRAYVKEKVGEKYLIPLIGAYKNANDIPFSSLPKEYIIKISQSCGMNYIVFNNDKEPHEDVKKIVNNWVIEAKHYYKYIEDEDFEYDGDPYIIVEKLLKNDDGGIVDDYKIYCFNGRAELIRVAENPVDENGKRKKKFVYNTYNRNWGFVELKTSDIHYSDKSVIIQKPINLDEMLSVAELLARDFPFARIDLYNIKGKIYFGEITWFPGGGLDFFEPKDWDRILGNMLELPM